MKAIKRACKLVGGQTNLARGIGVSPQMVNHWVIGRKPIALRWLPKIEKLTGGQVTAKQLRPDVARHFAE